MHKSPKLRLVKGDNATSTMIVTPMSYKTAETTASANYEGDRSKTVSIDIPESYEVVASKNMKNTYFVMNGNSRVATLYYSYEGGRGYSASDYITNVIAPKVSGLSSVSISTSGGVSSAMASSANSEFRVSSYGEWLVFVESTKANSDIAMAIANSVVVK